PRTQQWRQYEPAANTSQGADGLTVTPILTFAESAREIGRRFWAGAVKRGVYFSPGHTWFISPAHDDRVIEQTLDASEKAMAEAVG
ncbi:MAG: hypothetical protein ACP5R5_02630, partial [Armatimonadota bacterium]